MNTSGPASELERAVAASHLAPLPPDSLARLLAGSTPAVVPAGVGVVSLFTEDFSMPATVLALTEMRVRRFSPVVVRSAARQDPHVSEVLLQELSERALGFMAEIAGTAFTSVRQRVARHLLDLAHPEPAGSVHELVVTSGQRELAEAAGTAREVIVRVLRELRQERTVRTERDRIVLLEPERLIELSRWNTGS